MGDSFQIAIDRSDEDLHVTLSGDITDACLCEVVDILRNNSRDVMNVYIDTENVQAISTSDIGRDIFSRNICNLSDNAIRIQFTGKAGDRLKPEKPGPTR